MGETSLNHFNSSFFAQSSLLVQGRGRSFKKIPILFAGSILPPVTLEIGKAIIIIGEAVIID